MMDKGIEDTDGVFATRSFLQLTLDDLFSLQPGYDVHDSVRDSTVTGRDFVQQAMTRLKEKRIWIWWQEKKKKLRLFRSQSNAVLVRSKLAFSIIVFVGIATAIQLILIFRFFK